MTVESETSAASSELSRDVTTETNVKIENTENGVVEIDAQAQPNTAELRPQADELNEHSPKETEGWTFSPEELSCKKLIADITDVCDAALAQPTPFRLPDNACLVLKDALIAHGQKLFHDVACNPPRWIVYATLLRSEMLFKEAAVHIVGCWPFWPWNTPQETISCGRVLRMMANKSKELRLLRHSVDRKLLLATIRYQKMDRVLPVTFELSTDGSLAVAQFGQWFRNRLYKLQQPDADDVDPTLVGGVYRAIHRKSDYLTPEDVMEELSDIGVNIPFTAKELCECLTDLKDCLAKIVKPVVENNLMLHVEEHSEIKYLTCAEISENDIPWRAGAIQSRKRLTSPTPEASAKKSRGH